MPTYDYECKACRHPFELVQSIKAGPIKKCPKCGKLKVRRLMGTGGGILFKGSGFYQTDYRSSGYQEKAKQDSAAGRKPESAAAKPEASAKPESASKPEKPAPSPSKKKK